MKTVAIVLSNYNHGRFLRDSLGHICAQTRPADQIVVVDDGSTDDSLQIIEEFSVRHPTIQVIRNERNLGLMASICKALAVVNCDYMAWAASDDRLLANFLERNMSALARHPDAALSFSETAAFIDGSDDVQRFAENPAIRHIFDLSDLPPYLSPAALRQRMERAYLPMSSNTVVVRTELVRQFGGFPADLRWHSDSFTFLTLALRQGACVLAETLALSRATPDSYSTAMHDPARQNAVLSAILDLLRTREFSDIRRAIRRCPSNFSPYGTRMLLRLASRPGDWDLLLPFFFWRVAEVKTLNNLTWTGVVRRFAGHTLRLTRSWTRCSKI